MAEWIVGVDEAGRAPLAGPVSVGAVAVPEGFDVRAEFPGVADSKLLTPGRREELYARLISRVRAGDVRLSVRFSTHAYIDEHGITRAVRQAAWSGVRACAPEPAEAHVFLDGLLTAPPGYLQNTIIKGDLLVPVISLASIAAKVRRDRLMECYATEYPQYGFERHKGYPTRAHYAALSAHGLCAIHRRTYCTLERSQTSL